MPAVRDRIQGFCRVPARRLLPHPRNWRLHPPAQRAALVGMLREIGYAGALLARELPDGSLQLIDGHLRAETTPDQEVPVLLVDLSDAETLKLLALYDPLASLAEADFAVLGSLRSDVQIVDPALQSLLHDLISPKRPSDFQRPETDAEFSESYQVVVECASETEQRHVYERLTADGLSCRLLNL